MWEVVFCSRRLRGGGGGRVHCIPKAGRGLLLEKREAKDSLSLSLLATALFSPSICPPASAKVFLCFGQRRTGDEECRLGAGPPRSAATTRRRRHRTKHVCEGEGERAKEGESFSSSSSFGRLSHNRRLHCSCSSSSSWHAGVYLLGWTRSRERERGRCLLLRCVLYKRSGGDANEDEEAEADLKGGEGLWDFLRLRLSFMPLPY